jgi:hypothetical protein
MDASKKSLIFTGILVFGFELFIGGFYQLVSHITLDKTLKISQI